MESVIHDSCVHEVIKNEACDPVEGGYEVLECEFGYPESALDMRVSILSSFVSAESYNKGISSNGALRARRKLETGLSAKTSLTLS